MIRAVWERRADRYSEIRDELRARKRAARRDESRRGLKRDVPQQPQPHRSLDASRCTLRSPPWSMWAPSLSRIVLPKRRHASRCPPLVAEALRASGHRTKKGPVFDTAIIAGIMAAKRTAELIPFCHPLALEHCSVEIDFKPGRGRSGVAIVRCRVELHHKTGVEMEALTGVTVAALTIYDMCKALSHDIRIERVRLLSKSGGTALLEYPMNAAPLYGLVLAGGRSTRMQRDKATLEYAGESQLQRAMESARPLVERAFVSVRPDQRSDPQRAAFDTIADLTPGSRASGRHSGRPACASATRPGWCWPAICRFWARRPCSNLIAHRDASRLATAYRSNFDGKPEPLCAIYEPASREAIDAWIKPGPDAVRANGCCAATSICSICPSRARSTTSIPTSRIRRRGRQFSGSGHH